MQSRTTSRELALLILGQISDAESKLLHELTLDDLLQKALDSLLQYWREGLDNCAEELENAQQHLLDSELQELDKPAVPLVRNHLQLCIQEAEKILNGLSISLELPRLIALSDQNEIRNGAMKRASLVLEQVANIDQSLDDVMEGWRLKRLPRIDRDILRIAFVDIKFLGTPAAVACNEAVELANKYSDDQGRRMINGVLRRLQNASTPSFV